MKRIIVLLSLALLALTQPAVAQTTVVIATKVCSSASGVQVCNYVPVDAGNPLVVTSGGAAIPLTPSTTAVPSANLTLTAGGTSQALMPAGACPNLIYIGNAQEAANQGGIGAAEPIFVNLTGGPAAAGGDSNSIEISSGTLQPFVAQTTGISWIATTTGHKISVVCE